MFETIDEMMHENNSLRKKTHLAYAGLIGLAALSAMATFKAVKTSKEVNRLAQKNEVLQETASNFRDEAIALMRQKEEESSYVKQLEGFVGSIHPLYLTELDNDCNQEDCPECNKVEEENKKTYEKYMGACDTLGINYERLMTLKKKTCSQK